MKTRFGHRQVANWVDWCSDVSKASKAEGSIGPTTTAVMWLRSISATGISAVSRPGMRTSA